MRLFKNWAESEHVAEVEVLGAEEGGILFGARPAGSERAAQHSHSPDGRR